MISIELSDVVVDGKLAQPRDVIVSIEGRLRLCCDGLAYFEDEHFPLTELAIALDRWLGLGPCERTDFEFESMSAEEPGILWMRSHAKGWRVGSIWQESPCAEVVTLDELNDLVVDLISTVRNKVMSVGGERALRWFDAALTGSYGGCA